MKFSLRKFKHFEGQKERERDEHSHMNRWRAAEAVAAVVWTGMVPTDASEHPCDVIVVFGT